MGVAAKNRTELALCSGEALIRRLLYGKPIRGGRELLQIGQLPQILRLFGKDRVNLAHFSSGGGTDWEGDDGSTIKLAAAAKTHKHLAMPAANLAAEFMLHDLEFLSTVAWRLMGMEYPGQALRDSWEQVLDGHGQVIADALAPALAAALDPMGAMGLELETTAAPVNTTGFDRREVTHGPSGDLVFVDVPAYGVGVMHEHPTGVLATRSRAMYILENEHLRAAFDGRGAIVSLYEKDAEREALAGPGRWLLEGGSPLGGSGVAVRGGQLRGELDFRFSGGSEQIIQTVRLDAGSRRLEFTQSTSRFDPAPGVMEFPLLVSARRSTCAAPFGLRERGTAKAEIELTPFWQDLSEYGFGVAVVGPATLRCGIEKSLLSVMADTSFALVAHLGDWRDGEVIAESTKFARPILWGRQWAEPGFYVRSDDPNLVIETVKQAEDGNGLVIRLVEYHGGRGMAHIHSGLLKRSAWFCDGREKNFASAQIIDGAVVVPYRPHQIINLRLR